MIIVARSERAKLHPHLLGIVVRLEDTHFFTIGAHGYLRAVARRVCYVRACVANTTGCLYMYICYLNGISSQTLSI